MTTAAERNLCVPLYVTQVPRRTLSRLGMNSENWEVLVQSFCGIDPRTCNYLNTFISLDQHRQILTVASRAYGLDNFLRWYIEDTEAHHLGPIGLVARTAPTVREGLDLLVRFVPLLIPSIDIQLRHDSNRYSLLFKNTVDMGYVEDMYTELSVLVFRKFLLQGSPSMKIEVCFSHANPFGTDFHREAFGFEPVFNAPENSLTFDRDAIDCINVHHTPMQHQQALADCELLAKNARQYDNLRQRVHQIVSAYARKGQSCTLQDVADQMFLSVRTLTRRLQQESVHFREIQSEVRLDIARQQLRNTPLPIKVVAQNAGFSSLAAFTRAFRQQTGQTPGEFRGGQG